MGYNRTRNDDEKLVEPADAYLLSADDFLYTGPLSAPTPNLAIILFSALSGAGTGVLAFYLFFAVIRMTLPWSVGLATLALIGAVSGTAALITVLYDRRSVGVNVGFSCGLMSLLIGFSLFCLLAGAVAGTLALLF